MVPVFESPNLILTGWFSPLCSRRFINRDQKPFFLKNVILTFLWSENLYPVHPYRKAPSGALMSTPMTIEYNMSQFLSFLFTSLVSWKEVGCSRCIKGTVWRDWDKLADIFLHKWRKLHSSPAEVVMSVKVGHAVCTLCSSYANTVPVCIMEDFLDPDPGVKIAKKCTKKCINLKKNIFLKF